MTDALNDYDGSIADNRITPEVPYVHPRNLTKPATQAAFERLEDRRERLTRAYEEIRTMDTDLTEMKARLDEQLRTINEQATLIKYLDDRCQQLDKDRLLYAERAVSLGRQMQTIWHLCQEGDVMAKAAASIETAAGRKPSD